MTVILHFCSSNESDMQRIWTSASDAEVATQILRRKLHQPNQPNSHVGTNSNGQLNNLLTINLLV